MNFVRKPWGCFTYLSVSDRYWVKQIWVSGGMSLSLKRHQGRTESWTVLRGEGIVQIDKYQFKCKQGSTFSIPLNTWHRISNTGLEALSVIEVAIGVCFEGDIERAEDTCNEATSEKSS